MGIYTYQEDISISYLRAVCAEAKVDFTLRQRDSDSKDVTLSKKITTSSGLNVFVDLNVQLKSTYSSSEYSVSGNNIIYKLKAKNYNELCAKTTTDIVLALLILPNADNWIAQNHDELKISKSMYWCSLSGKTPTLNASTVSIALSKDNLLTPAGLNSILLKIAEERSL